MDTQIADKLLSESIRIGDDLLQRAEKGKNGYSWKTMSTGENQEIVWEQSEGIYSGVSGIVLFFIELYKQAKDKKYLNAVVKGARWVEQFCKNNPTQYYAFFTGRMGAAYVMLQISELLKDKTYERKAILIAKDCEQFLVRPNTVDDLINGTSGCLLGLLHLHSKTQEERLVPIIYKFIEHLIDGTHIGPEGVYWDKSPGNIHGLCGFSHGASGIGYVFLELARYFKNEDFFWLAEQAFNYENYFFDKHTGNWPDFRKAFYEKKTFENHKQEYINGNVNFFTTPGNMSAWCHGAPGIGLSRLRAYELLNYETDKRDIERAINQTYKVTVVPENTITSYTICHGSGGNAMLFLEAYRLLKEDKYFQFARKVAVNGLNQKKYIPGYARTDVEDYSLFMGNAGIGYYYLQLREPLSTPSVVKPDIKELTADISLDIDFQAIITKIAKRYFPKTFSLCSTIKLGKEKEVKKSIINGLSDSAEVKNVEHISSIFDYEKEKLSLILNIKSDAYLHISHLVERDKNIKLIDTQERDLLFTTALALNDNAKLFNTERDLINIENVEKGEYFTLVVTDSNQITEHEISLFPYLVLRNFETHKKGIDVLNSLVEMYEIKSNNDKKELERAVFDQIKEALQRGVLIVL